MMAAIVRYTASRLGLFAVPFIILIYVLGTRLWLLAAAVALLVSGIASLLLLSGQRDAVAEVLGARIRGLGNRIEARAAVEDPAHSDDPVDPADEGEPRRQGPAY